VTIPVSNSTEDIKFPTPNEIIKDVLVAYKHERTNKRCVIFVHGVTGNMYATWRRKPSADKQPADKQPAPEPSTDGFVELLLKDNELQDYDVFSSDITVVIGAEPRLTMRLRSFEVLFRILN